MRDFLSKEYDLLEGKTFRHLFVLGSAIFAFVILWLFQPFGLFVIEQPLKLGLISLYVAVGAAFHYIQFFPIQKLFIKHHTILSTILWFLLTIIIIGTSSYAINAVIFKFENLKALRFFYMQGIILSIMVIPISAFVLIHYNYTLKKRLLIAMSGNAVLKSTPLINKSHSDREIVFNSENKKEGLSIALNSFIAVSTIDNYIELQYLNSGVLDKMVLRYSLSKVEKDNEGIDEIFRCHKSFLINKTKIESVSGNAAGYKLKLKDLDTPIPVSRKWNNEIKDMTFIK